ncbi:alpha/beta hydrolase [Planomonospora parontospora]|uniref:alpha/beta hydrolase n=1 Tax=Planomonospora parontospora TaxID=58119 RepID=UPI0016713493|nr:alpha/beta fold hydrolase [Planomonospora parontospora]GGL19101.1 peptidase [Planomonospora parontospora subsp. antibiotica]GII15476.1 peptidase [Planomonospora parontospora subsp. antibiotica]
MRAIRAVAATAALAAALAACSGGEGGGEGGTAAPSGSAAPSGPVSWGPCTDIKRADGQGVATPAPDQQCGKLAVPLDYADPAAGTIDLALIRVKATGPGERIGSLLFNFGGPGASGVDTLAQAAKALGSLGARYDLVSFDPRGVERSSGVRCGGTAEMDEFTSVDSVPEDAAERAEIERIVEEFTAACGKSSGEVLAHVGTVSAAQDMDRIRAALGDQRLNYLGMSYGTQLGAVYATRYPEKVGRFVLDAPLDPSVSMKERTLVQTAGFQKAYEAFLKDCVKDRQCKIGPDADTADRNIEALMDRLNDEPLKVGDRELTQGLAGTGIAAALYSEQTWPLLDQVLALAVKGDGRGLLFLADSYTGRGSDGSYSTVMSSFPAISCVDTAERPDEAELLETEKQALKISPLFGSAGMGTICSSWPVPGDDAASKVDASGSAPIVVIAGTGDPATPYEWGPKLTAQLKTGVLVTYKGEGHGAYLSGDACVKKVTDAYLLEGKVPAEGTTCPV